MASSSTGAPVSRRLAAAVRCHAWNADGSMLAISTGDSNIEIYVNCHERATSKWEKKYTLTEHDHHVSGLDWSAATNALVSCSHDCSALVWNYNAATDAWVPTVTVLRVNRACTGVRWSPDGKKLAVASSAKLLPVLHYEAEGNWWVGKQIKTHKSTITDVAWHPGGKLVATASTDMVCRVFAAHLPAVDGGDKDGAQFGQLDKFGEVLLELNQAKAWVSGVAWSPSGFRLAFAAHSSTLFVAEWDAEGAASIDAVPSKALPNVAVGWLSDSCVVAAGHGSNPEVYALDEGQGHWELVGHVDPETKAEAKSKGNFGNARAMFAAKVSKGQDAAASAKDKLSTKHTAAISEIRPRFAPGATSTTRLSTCSVDGRVVEWDMAGAKLTVGLDALGLA